MAFLKLFARNFAFLPIENFVPQKFMVHFSCAWFRDSHREMCMKLAVTLQHSGVC